MPRVAFETLPDDARLWVFCAGRQLTGAEQTRLLAEVDAFLDQWGAHSQPLAGGRDLRYDRFLFVAVNPAGRWARPGVRLTHWSGG